MDNIYFVVFNNGTILYFGKEEEIATQFHNDGYSTIKITSLEELNIAFAISAQFEEKKVVSTTLDPSKTDIPSFEDITKLVTISLDVVMKNINRYAPILTDLKNLANKILKK